MYNLYFIFSEQNAIMRTLLSWVCGINENKKDIASQQIKFEDMVSIKEERRWKILSNIMAVILMCVAIVFFVYFA